jgi:beta-lactam-binding protein with PASTA domain
MMATSSNRGFRRRFFGRRPFAGWIVAAAAMAAALTVPTSAQFVMPVSSPFDMVGFIQSATIDNPSDVFSGGTITVNNIKMIVPRNTLLQFPATALTWQETFAQSPKPYTGLQSGLAMNDVPKPATTYEVRVQGNRVGDRHIVGLMFIAQQSLHAGTGYITQIDYSTGEMRVGGVSANPDFDTRIRINDPIGRFGRAFSPDTRFTIDEDNPTIKAFDFYPMCVPRTFPSSADDPLCPQKNRPKDLNGKFLSIYTMPPPGTPNGPDPNLMAPFEVGDYITYNGVQTEDARGPYISVHTIEAQLTIMTAPGTKPAYVGMNVLLMGVSTKAGAPAGTEGAVRTRVEGFSTDVSSNNVISVMALDVDPCTGNESERTWGFAAVDSIAVFGRFRFRPSAKDETFLPGVRELRVRNGTGTAPTPTPNGLLAGEYTAPIFEFIFSEAAPAGGIPPPPLNLNDLAFLAGGSGPYYGGGTNAGSTSQGMLGALSPWPGALVPVSTCGGTPPSPAPPLTGAGALGPAPTAGTDTVSLAGSSVTFSAATLLANDSGAAPVSLVGVAPFSAGGGAIAGSGPYTFTPGPGFAGSDSFAYQIIDGSGQTAVGTVNVIAGGDTTLPTVALTSPLGGIVSGNVVILASASDNVGVAGVRFMDGATQIGAEDTTPPYSVAWSTAALANGTHNLTAIARDNAGNVATSSIVSLNVLNANITVPDVVNLAQSIAQSSITGAGLTVGAITTANSATIAAGQVISQNPAAGASAAPNSAVALVVSLGRANVTVPNVVGQTQTSGQSAITAGSLTVGLITTVNSTTVPAGSIISQNPAGGASVQPGTAVALTVSVGPASVTVPSVVGQPQAAAQSALISAGLTIGGITTANSATVAAGSVISQSPTAGTSVAGSTSVALVVSSGPASVTVPNVVGQAQATAQSTLTSSGLTVGGVTTANSATVAAGSVISQSPTAGSSVAGGTSVALVVSLGPASVTVPNVVGQTQAAAQSAITSAGLTAGTITSVSNATVAAGSIISQSPIGGSSVAVGTPVAIVVSLGPAGGVPTVQTTVFKDGAGTQTTPAFSTTDAGEVLVAFATSDGPATGTNTQSLTVSGAGLTWTRIQRAVTSRGDAEIWTATAPSVLTNVTVTSTQAVTKTVNQSLTVVAFTGVSGVGASNVAGAASGAPNVSLVAQAAGSLVYAVGNDFDRAVARTVPAGQTKVHEFLAPSGDTFWVQALNGTTASAGATVTLNDSAPTTDQWNFAIVELVRQ